MLPFCIALIVCRWTTTANGFRRILRYRSYLREGVNTGVASVYLKQIAADEAELKRIAAEEPDPAVPEAGLGLGRE